MKKIVHVVGARPNYMKIAPLMDALARQTAFAQVLVNTGQHYDENMAGSFFSELQLPRPDRNLGVGSGSHAAQTARVMIGFEEVCLAERPDLVVVVGDVNSTMAAALVAAKLVIPIAHVEAGLRSFDRTMPEEINRIVTDRLADLLLTPSSDGDEHLRAEGVAAEKIHLVGNIMIDTLMRHLPAATFDRIAPRLAVEDGCVRGHDAAPAVQCRRPSGSAGHLRGRPRNRARSSRRVPGASPNARASGGVGEPPRPPRLDADRAAWLHRLPQSDVARRCRPDGFGRPAGGEHGAWNSVSDAAGEYGASHHDYTRHQPPGRDTNGRDSGRLPGSAAKRRGPQSARRCGTAARPIGLSRSSSGSCSERIRHAGAPWTTRPVDAAAAHRPASARRGGQENAPAVGSHPAGAADRTRAPRRHRRRVTGSVVDKSPGSVLFC